MRYFKYLICILFLVNSFIGFSQEGDPLKHTFSMGFPTTFSTCKPIIISGNVTISPLTQKRLASTLTYRYSFMPKHSIEVGYFIQSFGNMVFIEIPNYSNITILHKNFAMSVPVKYSYEYLTKPNYSLKCKFGYQYVRYYYVGFNSSEDSFGFNEDFITVNSEKIMPNQSLLLFETGIEKQSKKSGNAWYFGVLYSLGFQEKIYETFVISSNTDVLSTIQIKNNGTFYGFELAYIFKNKPNINE